MKTYIRHIGLVALAVSILGAVSCTANFEEINKPGGKISKEELKRDNFEIGAYYPNLINEVLPQQENRFQHVENMVGHFFARYFTFSKDAWFAGNNFPKYTVPDSWINEPFKVIMTHTYTNFNEIKRLTEGEGVGYAWAEILRVSMMHRLTDIYGPIPFSQVGDNLLTAYDSEKDLYEQFVDILTKSIDEIAGYVTANPSARDFAAYDKIYKGDLGAWARYANSLLLRMAIRMRFADPVLAKKVGEYALTNPVGLIETNAQNAVIEYSPNPIYKICVEWGDAIVTADVDSYMNGYQDDRANKMFSKASIDGSNRNIVGFRVGTASFQHAQALKFSKGTAKQQDKYPWMTASEVAFLKAEAALAGWAGAGNAEENYENGIRLSFQQWGAAGADEYIANAENTPAAYSDPSGVCVDQAPMSNITVKWVKDASDEEKLERIITQKWIALYPLGIEAWSEYRRTGYPKLMPLASAAKFSIPVANRLPFPPSEYQQNTANIKAAVNLLKGGKDDFDTKLWWQR